MPAPFQSVVTEMLHSFHGFVSDTMIRSGLCEIKWDGDGGTFAIDETSAFITHAVQAAIVVVKGLREFTLDQERNPTQRGIVLRIGIDSGHVHWHGTLRNIDSTAISQAEKIQQSLRWIMDGAAMIAISRRAYDQLPEYLQSRFDRSDVLTNSAGEDIFIFTERESLSLPTVSPVVRRELRTKALIVGKPIDSFLVVDLHQPGQNLEIEWSPVRLGHHMKRRWTRASYSSSHQRSQFDIPLGSKLLTTAKSTKLPAIDVRFRTDDQSPWILVQVPAEKLDVELPQIGDIDISLASKPTVPMARTPVNLVLRFRNSGNVRAMLRGVVKWAFNPTSQVDFMPSGGKSNFEVTINGYESGEQVIQQLGPDWPCALTVHIEGVEIEYQDFPEHRFEHPKIAMNQMVEFNWNGPALGRDDLLGQLRTIGRRAVGDGRGHIVVVQGEPGIGKTKLVRATVAGLRRVAKFASVRCRFDSNISESHKWAKQVISDLMAEPNRTMYLQEGVQVEDIIGRTGDLRAGFLDSQLPVSNDQRKGAMLAFLGILRTLSKVIPLVFVIEDLHNADTATLNLLETIARPLTELNVVIYATCREVPGRKPLQALLISGTQGGSLSIFSCPPLNELGLSDWLTTLFDGSVLRSGFALDAYMKTGGRPFYFEHWLQRLYDSGAIRRHRTWGWTIENDEAASSIYDDGMDAALMSRVNQLPKRQQTVVQYASVIGKVISWSMLEEIVPFPKEELVATIVHLVREGIFREIPSTGEGVPLIPYSLASDDLMRFDIGRCQEVVYDSIPKPQRKLIHERIAEIIERSFGPERLNRNSLLAYHWKNTDKRKKALPYVLAMAESFYNTGATVEASEYYRTLHRWTGDKNGITAIVIDALACQKLSRIYRWRGDKTSSSKSISQAYARITSSDSNESAQMKEIERAEFAELVADLAKLNLSLPTEKMLLCDILLELGKQAQIGGQRDRALGYFLASADAAAAAEDGFRQMEALRDTGLLELDNGRLEQAADHLSEALEQSSGSSYTELGQDVRQHLGRALLLAGRWNAALDNLNQVVEATDTTRRTRASAHNVRGEIYRLSGKWTESAREFQECRRLADTDRDISSYAVSNQAKLACQVGQFDGAIELATQYLGYCTGAEYLYGRAVGYMWRGIALHKANDPMKGRKDIESALDLFRSGQYSQGEALTNLYLGEIVSEDETPAALALLHHARDLLANVGDEYHMARCQLAIIKRELQDRYNDPESKLRMWGALLDPSSTRAMQWLCDQFFDLSAQWELIRFEHACLKFQASDSPSRSGELHGFARRSLRRALKYNRNLFDEIYSSISAIAEMNHVDSQIFANLAAQVLERERYPQPLILTRSDLQY